MEHMDPPCINNSIIIYCLWAFGEQSWCFNAPRKKVCYWTFGGCSSAPELKKVLSLDVWWGAIELQSTPELPPVIWRSRGVNCRQIISSLMSHQGDRLFKVIRKAVPRSSIISWLAAFRIGASLQLFLEPNGFRVNICLLNNSNLTKNITIY